MGFKNNQQYHPDSLWILYLLLDSAKLRIQCFEVIPMISLPVNSCFKILQCDLPQPATKRENTKIDCLSVGWKDKMLALNPGPCQSLWRQKQRGLVRSPPLITQTILKQQKLGSQSLLGNENGITNGLI